MLLIPANLKREIWDGDASEGRFWLGEARETLRKHMDELAGKVQIVYMDPPYMTGEHFQMRVRKGAADWRLSKSSLELPTFDDTLSKEEYLTMMREVLTLVRDVLSPEGMVYLHVDYRTQAHLRLMMDEIFGEENFLNEIIWSYQTGGRSQRYFSRKHDVILFYRKSAEYTFDMDAVREVPQQPKTNHMRKHVDPDGRVYRSIRVNDRIYTYYDDDPVAPGDVWDDISHLQQKDPERTGYDTQKPLALLMRMIKCASKSGDYVLDPFAGSSTTLEAAKKLGRRFIGIDSCPLTLNIARRRLSGANVSIDLFNGNAEAPDCFAAIEPGVGFFHITLQGYGDDDDWEDLVDGWSVGYIEGDAMHVMESFLRSKKNPELCTTLRLPAYNGTIVVCVYDIYGTSYCYFAENAL